MIGEKGDLRENPVIRILLQIHRRQLTGILYLKQANAMKVLYFMKGRLTWALSNASEDHLMRHVAHMTGVAPSILEGVRIEVPQEAQYGKALVERGVISLEALVESTRAQIRGIVGSVLTWETGSWQFTKDAPPERLLSLDIRVTEYVKAHILERTDMGRVWSQLGSLRTVLRSSAESDDPLLADLSASQKELWLRFDGHTPLEEILARVGSRSQEPLLKITYYLLVGGLLEVVPPDAWPPPAPRPAEAEADDPPLPHAPGVEIPAPGLFVPAEEPLPQPLPPEASPPRPPRESLLRPVPPEAEPVRLGKPPAPQPPLDDEELSAMVTKEEQQERTRNRRILIMWIFGFLMLLLGGWIWLKIPLGSGTPSFQNTPGEAGKPVQNPAPKPPANTPEPLQKEPVPEVPETPEPQKPKPATKSSASPRALMREARYLEAARIWQKQLLEDPPPYSILLELACREESIKAALAQTPPEADIFLLPRKRGEQTCFLLLWGRFQTREDAQVVLRSIPPYFWKQDPPEVTPLEAYL